jgi:ribA/ribD-fused uncharacterized protein
MKETDTMILFWNGWPSQWHPSKFFDQNGVLYETAEHYMMAEKARAFNDQTALENIMGSKSPREQKGFGRKVGTYDGADKFDSAKWDALCQDVVFRGTLFKFSQNPDLRAQMAASGEKMMVEASPVDKIWGIGLAEEDPRALDPNQWLGKNLLGIAIMRVRKLFKDNGMV